MSSAADKESFSDSISIISSESNFSGVSACAEPMARMTDAMAVKSRNDLIYPLKFKEFRRHKKGSPHDTDSPSIHKLKITLPVARNAIKHKD